MTTTKHLPRPVTDRWEWQLHAACVGLGSEVFFHPSGERGAQRSARAERAKAVCRSCPVIRECREHALAAREPYGVWGGLTEEERADVLGDQQQPIAS
ncbi:MAG: WhiB family transcriptional regulator [Pseudonocardiaceae bacterium]|nr:WhiB family transcriptional regulator [Pseudonocardiaceae bacterium]